METDSERRERALTLLRNHHEFPGTFEFRAVVRPETRPAVVSAVISAVSAPQPLRSLSERQSRQGNYVSVRIGVEVQTPEEVLDVYEVLRNLDGVLTAM